VEITDIPKFEERNKHLDLAINVVYQDDTKEMIPLLASKNVDAANKVDLLLTYAKTDPVSHHYALISDMSKIIARNPDTMRTWRRHLCYNCFNSFSTKTALQNHVSWCHQKKSQRTRVPEKGDTIHFQSKSKTFEAAYLAFFDFESLQVSPTTSACTCLRGCECKTRIEKQHVPFCYSALLVDRNGNVVESVTYTGDDCVSHFLALMMDWQDKYLPVSVTPLEMTVEEERMFQQCNLCHICDDVFEDGDKVRDHDHLTGKYLGAAHNRCNLHRKETNRIAAFAHNFSGYDSHFLIREIFKLKKIRKTLPVKSIPLNQQKFKILEVGKIRFMDSFAFLSASLDNLTETLVQSQHQFKILQQWVSDPNTLQLMLKKGVYPYEYVHGLQQLQNQTVLPPKDAFFSKLNGTGITDDDYNHAQQVWDTLQCRNMIDYSEMYVKLDVFLLAESIMELRRGLYEEFKLDIAHYFSLPMIAKDIMLKTTGVKIEQMSDLEMIHFVKDNIRGGLSYVNTRYFHEDVPCGGEKGTALYVDANNLVSIS